VMMGSYRQEQVNSRCQFPAAGSNCDHSLCSDLPTCTTRPASAMRVYLRQPRLRMFRKLSNRSAESHHESRPRKLKGLKMAAYCNPMLLSVRGRG
jgi:hypothetical protein